MTINITIFLKSVKVTEEFPGSLLMKIFTNYEYFDKIHLLSIVFTASMIRSCLAMMASHSKCRTGAYPRTTINRFPVPDDKVNWSVEYKSYDPPNYTSPATYGKPWADPDIGSPDFNPKWNSLDGKISRQSYMEEYQIVDGYPQNPIGRTGICGRGILGRWGPNHAADPVVTRWKKLSSGELEYDIHNKKILQFVAIKRQDTGEWALPGGMVDPGEKMTTTAVREFEEEAMNSLVASEEEKQQWKSKFKDFFSKGIPIYQGYVDDPRNTDNSWMETVAYNFHDEDGSIVGSFKLQAGDDAVGVRWVDIKPDLRLYASHKDIVEHVLKKHMP